MDLDTAIYSWLVFWITYWVFGIIIAWISHTYKIREATRIREVIYVLLVNMMLTLLGVIILCFCPLRAMVNSHIIIKLLLTYLITDIYFYHIHAMLHNQFLYYLHSK